MARVLIVRAGAGAPDALPIEAWHALTQARAFAAPDDPLAARLRELDYDVMALPEAQADVVRSESGAPADGMKGKNLLAHTHGSVPAGATALAARLADLALEYGDIAFIADDETVVRAVFERGLAGDVEVEVVVGRQPRGHRLLELVKVMARLRGPDGCPWDAEQTHQTLAKHLLDETYEVLDAIETGTPADLAEELGDLLLQVVFHAQMGTDASTFDIDDVAGHIIDKLVRRHPHVFADVEVSGAREVVANWDEIKQDEKQRESALDGIPGSLPALAFAQKLQRRAGSAGFEWPGIADVLAKVKEEAGELADATDADARERELGDLLLSLVGLARSLEIDAETALRRAARTFGERFRRVEAAARAAGTDLGSMTADELVRMWDDAKT